MAEHDRRGGGGRHVCARLVKLVVRLHFLVAHDHALLIVGARHDVDDQLGPVGAGGRRVGLLAAMLLAPPLLLVQLQPKKVKI